MITRRQLLLGIAGACGIVGGIFTWRFTKATDVEAISLILHRRLNYLRLDDTGIQQFASDLAARELLSSVKLRLIPALSELYEHLPHTHLTALDGIRHGEERVTSLFLLSSDFFANGADETRLIMYLGMYDPLHACGTPFARPVNV